ncbi:MAG: hypothetical protein Kow0092_07550 [Deferrisomatales bacterium]
MLGNVARDLRLLGYDTLLAGSHWSDAQVLRTSQSEGRVLLTRDRRLAGRAKGIDCVLIAGTDPATQAVEALRRLGSGAVPARPLTRCLECNGSLRALPPEEAAARVPDHVALAHRRFSSCPRCHRVYWAGDHARRLERRIRALLEALQEPNAPV